MLKNKMKKDTSRYKGLKIILAGICLAISARVVYLQVFRYEDFKEKADTRSMRFMAEKAPRGKIYDSNGNVLATNKQTYTATFTETEASKEAFYTTMELFLKLMKENNVEINDNFDLVIKDGKIQFDFGFSNIDNIRAAEIRFKKDKGIYDEIVKDLYPKQSEELTDEQIEIVEKKMLEISPEEVFYYLISKYEMSELLTEYKDRNKSMSEDADYEHRKAIKDRYKVDGEKGFKGKVAEGKRILDDLLKEKTLDEIREFMSIKDAVKMQSFSGFKPVTIAPSISKDMAFILSQKLNNLVGIDISLEPVRYYPYGELGANFLGYMGPIPSSNKNKYEERGYDISSDLIGMAGIESSFESTLRGTKGGNTVKVNAEGRKREELYSMQTIPGNNVHLTIDKDVQNAAEQMLETQINYLQGTPDGKNASRGAAVAVNVKTGEVLAMASYPSYDPNLFADGNIDDDIATELVAPDLDKFGAEYIKRSGLTGSKSVDDLFPKDENGVRQDPNDIYPKPMFNYATMGLMPPGSTFKPITALVALQEGVYTATETISDGAVLSGLNFVKHADLIDTPKDNGFHGTVDVKGAIQKSCNSFFYDTAVRLYRKYDSTVKGLDTIAKYAWEFGLGYDPSKKDAVKGTGIEIAERTGDVYNFEGSKEKFKTFSMWDLVSGFKKGQINSNGKTFAPINIEKNSDDSKDLKEAKESIKTLVKDEIEKITSLKDTGEEKAFTDELTKRMTVFYNASEEYKAELQKRNISPGEQFKIVSLEVWNWIQYNVKYQVVNASSLASASIGQGDTNVTPIEMVNAIAALANGGTRYKLNIVDKITTNEGDLVTDFGPEVLGKVESIDPQHFETVKEGMYMTNHVPGGTAYNTFKDFPIKTAGKTGTATFRENQNEVGRQAYGVYVSFAPFDDPEIAVCVVVYDGLSGGSVAPVARAIYETYWRDEIKTNYPGYSPKTLYANEPYSYTLNPDTMNYQDTGIFYETENDAVIEDTNIDKEEEKESNN